MSRWVYRLLVLAYVTMTSIIIVIWLMVAGFHLAEPVRWLILAGWIAVCLGGVFMVERLMPFGWPGYRLPIRAEEERLVALMGAVQKQVGSTMRIRFVICGEEKKPTRSLGYRTVIIQSGSLMLASDGELKGILAHELGHLRDGDRVLEAALATAGVFSQLVLWWWRIEQRVYKVSAVAGLLVLGIEILLVLVLLPFVVVDGLFRLAALALKQRIDYRQDAFASRAGYGEGLRAWLERSGLAANVGRIRRLEKMQ